MSLHRYFKSVDVLPSPKGALSTVVSPAAIKAANDELRKLSTSPSSRGPYAKVSSEQQAKVAQYASMHGNVSAARRFSKELGIVVKESSVRVWKAKYLAEIARKQETDETGDISVTKLPSKNLYTYTSSSYLQCK